MPAASTKKTEEREFVVDSGANMHMVSKKDLNTAELETVRISKNPTMVMTASGEVLAKEEATVYVRELDLFVRVMLLEYTPAVLSLGKLCEESRERIWVQLPLDHRSETTSHQERQENSLRHIKSCTLRCPGLSRSSSSSSSPTSPASSSQETVTPTEHPASARSESMSEEVRGNSSHGPAETETQNKNDDDEELQSGELQGVPSSRMDWLMKVFQNTETLPVQIMNYFQSCEQKWYRASTAFLLTSRRTEIAISAREPKLQGVLAEDVLVQSCPERGIWVI